MTIKELRDKVINARLQDEEGAEVVVRVANGDIFSLYDLQWSAEPEEFQLLADLA